MFWIFAQMLVLPFLWQALGASIGSSGFASFPPLPLFPKPNIQPIADKLPLRIMPLGASITWGLLSTDNNGYRADLRDLLRSGGNEVNMVGSRENGVMRDNDVEGWPGAVIDEVYGHANTSVPKYKPNVILINAGTNDCIQNLDIPNVSKRMRAMITHLYDLSPNVTIILSSLIMNKDAAVDAKVLDVNQQYADLVFALQVEKRKISFVQMHGEDGPQLADMADQTHPNDVGYAKMAAMWYPGLVEVGRARFLVGAARVDGEPDDGDDGETVE